MFFYHYTETYDFFFFLIILICSLGQITGFQHSDSLIQDNWKHWLCDDRNDRWLAWYLLRFVIFFSLFLILKGLP